MSKTLYERVEHKVAEYLLSIDAVVLRKDHFFTWSSGIRSPIYCDNRIIISYPEVRKYIAKNFAKEILAQFPDVEVIAGVATGGIPHAAWVAEELNLPMIYVRGEVKGHGRQNLIEGALQAGQKVVLVEDLVSTGASSLKPIQALNDVGAKVLSVMAIFTYEFPEAKAAYEKVNVPLITLSNFSALLDVAVEQNIVEEEERDTLLRWRVDRSIFNE